MDNGTYKLFKVDKNITKKLEKDILNYLDNLKLPSGKALHLTITDEKIEFVSMNKKEKYFQNIYDYCSKPKRLKKKTSWVFSFHKSNVEKILDFIKEEFKRIKEERWKQKT